MPKMTWGPDIQNDGVLIIDVNGRPVTLDRSTFALTVVNYEHHEVHEGSHYNCSYSVASVGALETPSDMMTLTFVTPNTTKWVHLIFVAICSSGARLRFIEGGTGGGASPTGNVSVYNSNRNSVNVSGILDLGSVANKISYDATLVTGGISLVDVIIGAEGLGTSFVAGSSRPEQEWVLKRNTQYQLSLYETDTVPGTLQMSWYEHADKA